MQLLASAPRKPAHQRWWDIPAKVARAKAIKNEEEARAWQDSGGAQPHNNAWDALRHARAAARTSHEVGPIFATAAGYLHELRGIPTERQPLNEVLMDLHNNSVGLDAARRGVPIDRRRLQLSPDRAPPTPRHAYLPPP